MIPHGMAWGNSTPPNTTWELYLDEGLVNNKVVRLLEVYSGHGNSEEYRNFSEREIDDEGNVSCPEPQENFYPSWRRAGDIIRQWCLEEGFADEECQRRELLAQQYFVGVPTQLGWLTVPGSEGKEWREVLKSV